MLDFKAELLKYKPVKELKTLESRLSNEDELLDIMDLINKITPPVKTVSSDNKE